MISSIHKTPGFFLVFIWIFVMKKDNIERQNHETVHLECQTGQVGNTLLIIYCSSNDHK